MRKAASPKERAMHVLCTGGILLCAGFLYALLYRTLQIGVPCPIHALTGLKCPGCGVTRMCMALLRGDLRTAFVQNRAVFLLLPVFAYLTGAYCAGYIRHGDRLLHGFAKAAAIGAAAILLTFGVLRNIFGW